MCYAMCIVFTSFLASNHSTTQYEYECEYENYSSKQPLSFPKKAVL